MGKFTELSGLIQKMVENPPTLSPGILSLVNVTEYMDMIDRVRNAMANSTWTLDADR